MKVGILSLQGAVTRHRDMLARLGVDAVAVKTPEELDQVDGLILPGGESTTMSLLLESSGLFEPLIRRLGAGMPAFGTCAGMILLASEILDGRDDQRAFGAIAMAVRRNAYGRQVESFEADLDISGLGSRDPVTPVPEGPAEGPDARRAATRAAGRPSAEPPFHAVFIRAPVVEQVGPEVEVLAEVDGRPVLCRQGPALAGAFHPELGDDLRVHEYFVSEVM